jgi:C-terminal processing protease CtpA/Prc
MADDAAFLDGIDAAMQRFRDTTGLIIDVRGNGGGRRDALLRLAPYLLPEGGEPIVGNVAAILLEGDEAAPADALADRYLYRADWTGWSDAQRRAIATFLKGFEPSWKLPRGKFSPWHFLVLDRATNAKAFAYKTPVIVLIDRGCFSATDVFAAALQAIPVVTLVGEPTSGGSGRARGFRLPNSQIRLQLSSMASFRPDGVLFEGNGVVPDVPVATQPTDLIGETDTALAKALELLR